MYTALSGCNCVHAYSIVCMQLQDAAWQAIVEWSIPNPQDAQMRLCVWMHASEQACLGR